MPSLSRETFWGQWSLYGCLVGLAGFAVDRAHKWWMINVYDIASRGRVEVTSFFDLVMAWNQGVSYGLFEAQTATGVAVLAGFAIAVIIGLGLWLARVEYRVTALAIGLILGGALGNVYDRIFYGAVADFFSFHAFGFYWYIFNIADVWIALGVGLIILESVSPGLVGAVKKDSPDGKSGGTPA